MIYIQSNKKRTLPYNFECSSALYGSIDSNLKYRLTSFDEVVSGKFDKLIKKNLFIGTVEFMKEVFKRIEIKNVKLPMNSNRDFEIITISEVFKRFNNGEKLFVKPIEIKLFTGFVLDKINYHFLEKLPEETLVMAYKPFESLILSEWRLYVHNDKLVDSKNYSGDFTISPDYNYALTVINNNKNKFPYSYTIDIGILENKENVVIEFNDMWSIGNYGIPNDLYLRLLKDRYFQIVLKR